MGRTGTSRCCWLLRLALGVLLLLAVQGVQSEHEPTESECRPYIEKALKDHHVEAEELFESDASSIEQEENPPIDEAAESNEEPTSGEEDGRTTEEGDGDGDGDGEDQNKTDEQNDQDNESDKSQSVEEPIETDETTDTVDGNESVSQEAETVDAETAEETGDNDTTEDTQSLEADTIEDGVGGESVEETGTESVEGDTAEETGTDSVEGDTIEEPGTDSVEGDTVEEIGTDSVEGDTVEVAGTDSVEGDTVEETGTDSVEGDTVEETGTDSVEGDTVEETGTDSVEGDTVEETDRTSIEGDTEEEPVAESLEGDAAEESIESDITQTGSVQDSGEGNTGEVETGETAEEPESTTVEEVSHETVEGTAQESQVSQETVEEVASDAKEESLEESKEPEVSSEDAAGSVEDTSQVQTQEETSDESSQQEKAVEDLTLETIIPENLRSRDHITQILKLDQNSVETESALTKSIETTLKTLKNLYDNAIKPLEILYKYRDLSNRHFGDPEIFSKPLVLFMGPWSGGKSSTINYLLDLEFKELALRTGAEPSPAYFNILTYGEEIEILDGTQLAADWTFSGLQKFGQGMLDRLRGVKLPNRLLEKVNIVEIPGILEIRKQVQRLFPFNDACQWFIDRADIIFLVYDPAKLDVGPETEAILDQLKGREYQTRIILNKADTVKPEELMRVQGTLIWNISPLMSSQEPPVMYTTSLWSLPYESSAPSRLLIAQERAFLRDLRDAIDRRIENKIASARRFAVRVRNHAKMVDCYLTTYYNHKTLFGNRKKISDDIIENPTKYHIYEGLSTLTNISRYDLPDPDMYRDFFRINPLYEFTKLSDTCTYFRGCPINKLDVAIAYDLPELVGKYKKAVEAAKTAEAAKTNS